MKEPCRQDAPCVAIYYAGSIETFLIVYLFLLTVLEV